MKLEDLRELTDDELCDRFPFMVVRDTSGRTIRDKDGKAINSFCSWGWRDIQLALAEHILPIYKKLPDDEMDIFYLSGVKEKFGELRCYWSMSNDTVDLWTWLAQYISLYTCIKCGKTEKTGKRYIYHQSRGWISPFCGSCAESRPDRSYDVRLMKPKLTFERYILDAPKQKITLSTKDFWNLD